MRTIIVGALGEVGKALTNVLAQYEPDLQDLHYGKYNDESGPRVAYGIMHVCFPYSDTFVEEVKKYKEIYHPEYTVIHSTVPVGVSSMLGAVHSPIRGLHPDLEGGIRMFVKFIGGTYASLVADYFRRAGLRVMLFDESATTEAMKLFDTEYYRTCIEFAHRVKTYCDRMALNFHEVYTLGNETYNEAYTKLGHPEFVRPILQPINTKIGGHCVLPNKELIKLSEDEES